MFLLMTRPSVSEVLVIAVALLGLTNFQMTSSMQRVDANTLDHLDSIINDDDDWMRRIEDARKEPVVVFNGLERRSFTSRDQSTACTAAANGHVRFACPRSREETHCIADDALCNGRYDCPRQEDEDPVVCLFYKFISSQMRAAIRSVSSQSSQSSQSSESSPSSQDSR